uniref:Uncharacterized protein n=1 Tax=Fagus sylvatica TaxID=28930 RepID=A0A2N9FF74_FAGSY
MRTSPGGARSNPPMGFFCPSCGSFIAPSGSTPDPCGSPTHPKLLSFLLFLLFSGLTCDVEKPTSS